MQCIITRPHKTHEADGFGQRCVKFQARTETSSKLVLECRASNCVKVIIVYRSFYVYTNQHIYASSLHDMIHDFSGRYLVQCLPYQPRLVVASSTPCRLLSTRLLLLVRFHGLPRHHFYSSGPGQKCTAERPGQCCPGNPNRGLLRWLPSPGMAWTEGCWESPRPSNEGWSRVSRSLAGLADVERCRFLPFGSLSEHQEAQNSRRTKKPQMLPISRST
jgi:hypothetical protein